MPHEFEIDVTARLTARKWTGIVTPIDVRKAIAEIEGHSDFDPSFDMITDYSNAELRMSFNEIRTVMEWVMTTHDWPPEAGWVIIMPSDYQFGLGRQALAFGRDNSVVCRSQKEARAWLMQRS